MFVCNDDLDEASLKRIAYQHMLEDLKGMQKEDINVLLAKRYGIGWDKNCEVYGNANLTAEEALVQLNEVKL